MQRRVRLMIGRGIIRLVNDAAKEQEVQITLLAGEVHDKVERYQEYGFTSAPLPGAECITASVGGNRGHTVVIATGDRRYRLKSLSGGEVALYDDQGQSIILKRGKEIAVSGCTKVTVDASETEFTGSLSVSGDITSGGNVSDSVSSMAAMRTAYSSDNHGGVIAHANPLGGA